MRRRSKKFKLASRTKGMRLKKRYIAEGWSDDLIETCEAAANKLLRVGGGSYDKRLRGRTWKKESPRGLDVTPLSACKPLVV